MSKQKNIPVTREELEHFGSLITFKREPCECLGDLRFFAGHGYYDPVIGKVPVTKEEANAHNLALDTARLEKLDKSCEIGQGSYANYKLKSGLHSVTSFIGTVISEDVTVTGESITFRRNGKVFRGTLRKDSESFNYRRVR